MNEGLRNGLVGSDGRGRILRRDQGRSGDEEGGNGSGELHLGGQEKVDTTVAEGGLGRNGTQVQAYETKSE